ncbi:MAG: CoA transferase [Deltaproteobacteria bacterium]|nr:CoA transferase [Deltaproteobacteria bacterium]
MNTLLDGLKILDFTTLLPGPFATMMLGDMGAEILRIESPTRLDMTRLMPPMHAYINRNKKSLALDLKYEESIAIVERLIADLGYDIIIEQFRPGVMERLGLSYEKLSQIEPGLIYCSLTGYGQSGPLSHRAGHDINYLSHAGIMSYSGRKDSGPSVMGIQVADVGSGSNNSIIGILAAVIKRMNTAQGQHIDVSMTDCLFPYHAIGGINVLAGQEDPGFETEMLSGGSLYGFYETSDGKYISFGGLEPQFFSAFCKELGLDDLIEGGIFQVTALEQAKKRVADIFKTKPREYWLERFNDLDACVEPVLSISEAVHSDHARHRGILIEMPAPDGKSLPQFSCPIQFSKSRPIYKSPGCALGEHTHEIMKSLGYSDPEIATMKSKGILGNIIK